jgi:hypothetical protein
MSEEPQQTKPSPSSGGETQLEPSHVTADNSGTDHRQQTTDNRCTDNARDSARWYMNIALSADRAECLC